MAKIKLGKQYNTRDGRGVKIFEVLETNGSCHYTVFGMMHATSIGDVWIPAMWTAEGKFDLTLNATDGKSDLVSIYEIIPLDAPVLAWNTSDDMTYGHFAGVDEDGLPMIWADGRTSYSSRGNFKRVSFTHAFDETKTV